LLWFASAPFPAEVPVFWYTLHEGKQAFYKYKLKKREGVQEMEHNSDHLPATVSRRNMDEG
jgi:hypothetical protein